MANEKKSGASFSVTIPEGVTAVNVNAGGLWWWPSIKQWMAYSPDTKIIVVDPEAKIPERSA